MSLGLSFRVFVYGTLKRGEPNAGMITDTDGRYRFVGEGRTKVLYPLIVASKYNIPFVLNEPGKGYQVEGEVYEIDDVKLNILDKLEAYPTLYWRQEEKILLSTGKEMTAWIYLLRNWRSDIYEIATPMMSNYSSNGDHGKKYVPRHVRAKEILRDGYDLHADIFGSKPKNPSTLTASQLKALYDAKTLAFERK